MKVRRAKVATQFPSGIKKNKMSNHPIYPDTSKEAYESLTKKYISDLKWKILKALSVIKQGHYEKIAEHMKEKPERVRKRLIELVKDELIHRPGEKLLTSGGRNAFVYALGKGDNTDKLYEKGTATAADYAQNIIEHGINKRYVQPKLFADVDKDVENASDNV